MTRDVDFHSSRKVRYIVFTTYLYSLTNEIAIYWTSPVLAKLRYIQPGNPLDKKLSISEQEWLGSLICLGYMAGLIPYSYLCSRYGRKYTLLSLGFIHLIAFGLYTTSSLPLYYVGRFLSGIASSVGFVVFPMYISEICKDTDRGKLLVSRQIFAGCGTVIAYVAGNYLSMLWFNILICVFPLLFLISFGLLAVESPYFYVTNERYDNAKEVYIELTSPTNGEEPADEEIQEMKRAVEMTDGESLGALLSQKHIQKSIIIVLALFIFQQLTGYMAYATYTELIVESKHATVIIGMVVLIGSSLSTMFVDKFGRKLHLLVSASGVVLANIALAVYFTYFKADYYTPIICISAFFLSYNLGFAFIPQILCAEILPQKIKFGVGAVAGVLGWGVAFLITNFFLEMNNIYLIVVFCICPAIQLAIIYFYVPETKGQSFRMIQGMLQFDMSPESE